jgi:hypothetical protein
MIKTYRGILPIGRFIYKVSYSPFGKDSDKKMSSFVSRYPTYQAECGGMLDLHDNA